MKRTLIGLAVLVAVFVVLPASAMAADRAIMLNPIKPAVQPVVVPFDLAQVRLLDGPCKAAQDANGRYLLSLNPDRLLKNFRAQAGLPAPGRVCGGWEAPDCELRGHFVGHYLSGLALMYKSTADKRYRDRLDLMVGELAKCQTKIGTGYLSAFPTTWFDKVETRQRIWAPYYTIHKIMAGMYDAYTLCGSEQALDVLLNMADYFYSRNEKLTPEQIARMLGTEFGGMNDIFYKLYRITGSPRHLKLAHDFDKMEFLSSLAKDEDNLTGRHGNTHIPIVLGAAQRYEITGDADYKEMSTFFWNTVVNTRTYAMGGSTTGERWTAPNKLANSLGGSNAEICKTHNMLKLTRVLFGWNPDPVYADFYERAFWNGIMGTQDAGDGQMLYYVPLAPGSDKNWGTAYGEFWCCYGTGVETWAKTGDSIYFHDDNSLYVNLFISSVLDWTEKGVQIEQKTNFPEQPGTTLTVHTKSPDEFAIKVHIPYWATNGIKLKINGQPVAEEESIVPTSYVAIDREWKDGDTITIEMPMSLHTHVMPDDGNVMAIMYGPIVLAGLVNDRDNLLIDSHTDLSWLKPVPGKVLTFIARAANRPDITFVPLNKIIKERYTVYWKVIDPKTEGYWTWRAEERAKAAREARVVDRVIARNQESEAAHNLKGTNLGTGRQGPSYPRFADAPDWWSWDLKVLKDTPMVLSVSTWPGGREDMAYDILINGKVFATEEYDETAQMQFDRRQTDKDYPIPAALIAGKDRITVKFRPYQESSTGAIFGCATMKAEKGK